MLIINADDLGRTSAATDNIIACYSQQLITSASAMVFMLDSKRAAELATTAGLATGLHLNLTQVFDARQVPSRVRQQHSSIVSYFCSSKWAQLIYNPFLKKKLEYIFAAQYDEYCRLFSKEPEKIDGHHHMHLCMNIILGRIIPPGLCVRRNFSFEPGEKGIINRLYRRIIDAWLIRHYCCSDSFFSLEAAYNPQRLKKIIDRARSADVELMVHPERKETHDYLMSSAYRNTIAGIPMGTYRMLSRSSK
jgi:chitin disaccharide deacetylase